MFEDLFSKGYLFYIILFIYLDFQVNVIFLLSLLNFTDVN